MDYMGYQYPYQPMNNMFRPSMSSMSSMNGFIKVNGIDGAKAYQMPPNSSVPLFVEMKDKWEELHRNIVSKMAKAKMYNSLYSK